MIEVLGKYTRFFQERVRQFFGRPLRELDYIFNPGVHIRYLGFVGFGNLGDEAICQAVQELYPPNAVFYNAMADGLVLRTGKRQASFKQILLGGGTLIKARSLHLERMESLQRLYQEARLIVFGTGVERVEFWEQFGFTTPIERWVKILEGCDFIGVRGPASREILSEWGVSGQVEVIGDPACWYADSQITAKDPQKKIGINLGPSGGFIHGGDECEVQRFAASLLGILHREGWRITLVPMIQGDIPFMMEAARMAGIPEPAVHRDFLSLPATRDILRKQDVFLGEKLHSVILADSVYTPTIMLEYRPKCRDYMLSMNREEWIHRTDQLDADKIFDDILDLSTQIPAQQRQLFEMMQGWKTVLKRAADRINQGS